MNEYLPILIVGAIIGMFAVFFLSAYALEKNKKESMGFERHMDDREIVRRLMRYAAPYKKQFVLVFLVMLLSIGYDIVSPLLVGHIEETVKGRFELSYLFSVVAVYAGILIVSLICTYVQAMILQKTGQTILSAAIIDDILGIMVLTFVIGLKDPAMKPLIVVVQTFLFFVFSLVFGFISYKIFKKVDKRYPHTQRIPIAGLAYCFALSYIFFA